MQLDEPDGASPIGADDKFEILEGVLRDSLRLRITPEMADKMARSFDEWLRRAKRPPGRDLC
jgi:hypothetical protein